MGRTGRGEQNGSVQGRDGKQSTNMRVRSPLSEKVLACQVADLGKSGALPPGPAHQSAWCWLPLSLPQGLSFLLLMRMENH